MRRLHTPLCRSSAPTPTLSRRPLTSFIQKLSDSVAAKVTKLTEEAWIAEDKLVTEPRRKIEPQNSLPQTLAERLATQRGLRQQLVPLTVKVDKSRQYVEFTWPGEAVALVEKTLAETAAAEAATATSAGPTMSSSDSPLTAGGSDTTVSPPSTTSSSSSTVASVSPPVRDPRMPVRTRALAEYLRAYTPSTDGALGARDIVVYGRRGVTITKIIPIGNYALRFVFSDEHTGGIYTYEYLYYLTGPRTKYGLMRTYIRELKRKRKSRMPPKRAPSKRVPRAPQSVST